MSKCSDSSHHFCIEFVSKLITFPTSMLALIYHHAFHGKWLQKLPKSDENKKKNGTTRDARDPLRQLLGVIWRGTLFFDFLAARPRGQKSAKFGALGLSRATSWLGKRPLSTRLRSRKRHLQQRPASLKACFRDFQR